MSPRLNPQSRLRNNPAFIYQKNQQMHLQHDSSVSSLKRYSPEFEEKSTRLKPTPGQFGLAFSSIPSPIKRNEELNSDILVLISNPERNGHQLAPLKLSALVTHNTSESSQAVEHYLGGTSSRPSFNYPPDLRTAN